MSCQFKNLLVVTRDTKHTAAVSLVRDRYKIWFDEQPFQYKSADDKIVVFFKPSQSSTKPHQPIENTVYYPEPPQGYLKLLCDGLSIKVTECIFNDTQDTKHYMSTFRSYLIATIKDTKPTDFVANKFTIYWSDNLLNPQFKQIIMDYGLLTNNTTNSHTFTQSEVQDISNFKPQNSAACFNNQQSTPSFGLSQTNQLSNTFNTQQGGSSLAANSIPSFGQGSSNFVPPAPSFGSQGSSFGQTAPSFGTQGSSNFGTQGSSNNFGTQGSSNFGTQGSSNNFGTQGSSNNFGTQGSSNFGTQGSSNFGTQGSSNFGTQGSSNLSSNFGTQGSSNSNFGAQQPTTFGSQQPSNIGNVFGQPKQQIKTPFNQHQSQNNSLYTKPFKWS